MVEKIESEREREGERVCGLKDLFFIANIRAPLQPPIYNTLTLCVYTRMHLDQPCAEVGS